MSWLSRTASKVIDSVSDSVIGDGAAKLVGRKRSKEALAAIMGGTHGMQYQHSRNRGMSDSEAQGNTLTRGFSLQQYRGEQKVRVAEEAKQEADAIFERKRVAEEARARGQVAARVRRGMRTSTSTKGGTLATGPGGLGSTGNFGAFAALLGL